MVRIRYSELPAGLHVTAVAVGRETVVYLLPGLTSAERKSALLRVRGSARFGHGPHLPAFALARALVADRLRAAMRTLAAVMRRHPVLLVPVMALMLSVTVLVIVSGTAGATPGRLAGPLQRPAVTSPPMRWQRFARRPEPLAWKHYLLRVMRDRHRHGSDQRGATSGRGGYLALRARDRTSLTGSLTPAVLSHHQARNHSGSRHYSRRHRARHRWYGPAPCHVGISAASRAHL
jgi:hypothetical protein